MKWEEGALECVFRELEGGRRGKYNQNTLYTSIKINKVYIYLFSKAITLQHEWGISQLCTLEKYLCSSECADQKFVICLNLSKLVLPTNKAYKD